MEKAIAVVQACFTAERMVQVSILSRALSVAYASKACPAKKASWDPRALWASCCAAHKHAK